MNTTKIPFLLAAALAILCIAAATEFYLNHHPLKGLLVALVGVALFGVGGYFRFSPRSAGAQPSETVETAE